MRASWRSALRSTRASWRRRRRRSARHPNPDLAPAPSPNPNPHPNPNPKPNPNPNQAQRAALERGSIEAERALERQRIELTGSVEEKLAMQARLGVGVGVGVGVGWEKLAMQAARVT